MAMFRAMSTNRNRSSSGYNRLLDETMIDDTGYSDAGHQAVLKRTTSVPVSFGSSSNKQGIDTACLPPNNSNSKSKQQQGKKSGKGKVHPLFSLFEGKGKKKKVTANPDFSRYIEYLKEGGMWNKDTDSPVIHYK